MSACKIDGNTVKAGMINFLNKELMSSDIFEKDGDYYTVKNSQQFAAQQFINGLNTKFSEDVIKKNSSKTFSISISEPLLKQYVVSSKQGQDLSTEVGMFADTAISPESWNKDQVFQSLNYPEISDFTYSQLISFLKSLNSEFRVEEVEHLSEEGLTNVKDFLIKVKTMSKFSAMPEETAHAFIELLPDTNPLKQEMVNNITSFPIYSQTLAQYKDQYTKDGKPDYDKIKREASAKLVGEYVTALATDNHTRVQELTKVKAGWIQRWLGKFMQWLGIGMRDNTRSYADIAGIILSGTNDQTLKDARDVEDVSYTDSYFYRLSEDQLYKNAAELIVSKPPNLLETISKFSKEFGRRFNDILKDEKYKELNDMLKRNGQDITKINRMSEIKVLLGEADIDLRAALDSDAYLTGVKQFLEAVDRLDILSDSILKVVESKEDATTFDQAIKNIEELEGYFGIYETFNNIISAELAQALIDSKVTPDVIESIQRTQVSFKNVNDHILTKLRNDLFVFYKGMLAESNSVASHQLLGDIERSEAMGNKDISKMFKDKMKNLITTDEEIIKMLSGRGRDIDNYSSLNHLINASRTNGDVYVAGISNYIQTKIEASQGKAKVDVLNLYQRIDPLQKKLNEDAIATGKKITIVDKIWDNDTAKEREVLTWQNPHKGISLPIEAFRRNIRDLSERRAKADTNSTEFKELDKQFKKAQKDKSDFLEKYMHRPFVKEYYTFNEKYVNDTDFITAMRNWKEFSDFIRDDESLLQYEPENSDIAQQLAKTRRDRANLLNEYNQNGDLKSEAELKEVRILKAYFEESGKFKEEDEVQTERSYMIARNRYEQRIDYAISGTRNGKFKDIYEIEKSLQDLLKDSRIRVATLYNESNDPKDPIDYDFIKKTLMAKWYKKNITIQRNDAFYEFEANLRKELNDLQKKGELSEAEINIKNAYESIRNVLFGSRNDIGQVNPDSLSEEEKSEIISLEDFIAEQKKDKPGVGVNVDDFTPEDRQRFEDLSVVINNPEMNTGRKRSAMRERSRIANKYKNVGKNKQIRDLINILGSLTEKTPTNYYWDKMITLIPHMAEFGKYVNNLGITKEEAEEMNTFVTDFTNTVDTEDWDRLDFVTYEKELFDSFLDWLKEARPKEYNWFVDSHSEKTVFDHANGNYVKIKYARSAIYNYSEPVLQEHKKILFNRRFRKQRVKDEYRTGYNPDTKKVELQVGRHISNREYNGFPEFLPLLPEDGAPANSPYRNQAYYDLRDKDPIRFQYLQELRNSHLEQQQKLPARLRTWNAVPVMHLSHLEEYTPEHFKDVLGEKRDYIKSIFKKNEAGDAEAQLEGVDTTKDINQFTQTTITDRIPKLGMAQKVPVDRVSRNLLESTAQFAFRAHEFEARSQAEPVVKTLVRVMKDNAFKNQMSNKERAKKFESIYSQMILQEVPETTLNNKQVRRIAKFLTSNTALRMIADPIGGIINYSSAMINNIIEASAGKYLNLNDLAKGKALAFRINASLMSDYNKKANLSVDTLLFDTFDFIQGEFEEDLLSRSSSKNKHAAIRQILMIPRKSGELMAQTAIAMGMLDRSKVKNELDGKMYPAHSIYTKEKNGNTLVLKEGFPQEWNPVDGEKFFKIKRLINRVNLELHGNYAKVSQSEASRYAIGKLAENMKRWFMPAFQRRFGRETVDVVLEDLNEGYYRTTAKAVQKLFGSLFHLDFGGTKDWMSVFVKTPRYRQNLQRMGAELVQTVLLWLTFAVVLGYSGDDKNKQLDSNSWIHNTAILLALRVYSETTAYTPFPQVGPLFGGFQELKRNVLTPFSLPADAISNFAAIGQLGLYQVLYWMGADSLHDNLYYSKDSGYWYSNKGDSKLLKYVLRVMGYTGYTGVTTHGLEGKDVATYIKQFNNLQGRLK